MVTLFPPLLPASDFDHFRYFLWRSPVAFAPSTWLTAQRGAVRSVTGHVTGLSSRQWPRDIPLHTHTAFVHSPGPASGTWAPRRGPGGRWLPSPPPCSGGGGRGCARASPRSRFELLWVSGQKRARRARPLGGAAFVCPPRSLGLLLAEAAPGCVPTRTRGARLGSTAPVVSSSPVVATPGEAAHGFDLRVPRGW